MPKSRLKKLLEAKEKMKNDPCWKGYRMLGKKKDGDKEVPNCVPEAESLGVKIARLKQQNVARDWNKKSSAEKLAALKKHREDLEKRRADMKEEDWDDDFDMTGCPLLEKLNPSMGIKKYINDFSKSDAPQFKGASASKRRRMAVAAYLSAKRKKLDRGE